jgi:hypothetical protein
MSVMMMMMILQGAATVPSYTERTLVGQTHDDVMIECVPGKSGSR